MILPALDVNCRTSCRTRIRWPSIGRRSNRLVFLVIFFRSFEYVAVLNYWKIHPRKRRNMIISSQHRYPQLSPFNTRPFYPHYSLYARIFPIILEENGLNTRALWESFFANTFMLVQDRVRMAPTLLHRPSSHLLSHLLPLYPSFKQSSSTRCPRRLYQPTVFLTQCPAPNFTA